MSNDIKKQDKKRYLDSQFCKAYELLKNNKPDKNILDQVVSCMNALNNFEYEIWIKQVMSIDERIKRDDDFYSKIEKNKNKIMSITCVGCLHGHFPKLERGDLLIVTGDLTARDTDEEHGNVIKWLWEQPYKKIILIAGNHDNYIQKRDDLYIDGCSDTDKIVYLCDSGTEYEGLKIFGSPWTKKFECQNPKAMAFCLDTDEELEEKWKLIPDDIDILITHGPPYGILDKTEKNEHVGCKRLNYHILNRLNLKMNVFSHIHDSYGKIESYLSPFPEKLSTPIFINCSIMDDRYKPIHKPIRITL